MKLYELLAEKQTNQYMDMFNTILSNVKIGSHENDIKYAVNEEIKSLKQILNRNDFITYMLGLYRQSLFNSNSGFKNKVNNFEQLQKKYNPTNGNIDYSDIKEKMKHYLSYSDRIVKIKDYRFTKQEFPKIFDTFEQYEQEYNDSINQSARNIDMSNDTTSVKIISFPDGSAWFDLNKESCDIEAEAMGHCGNKGDPKYFNTVLSYRTPNSDGTWTPHLTFILNTKTKTLGEMKGRANSKPTSKYHPYIIELLKSDYVDGIVGGGYKPENNFSITDLPEKVKEQLVKLKPWMGTPYMIYNTYGFTKDFINKVEYMSSRFGVSSDILNDDTHSIYTRKGIFGLNVLTSYEKHINELYVENNHSTKKLIYNIFDQYYSKSSKLEKSKYHEIKNKLSEIVEESSSQLINMLLDMVATKLKNAHINKESDYIYTVEIPLDEFSQTKYFKYWDTDNFRDIWESLNVYKNTITLEITEDDYIKYVETIVKLIDTIYKR